LTWIDGSIGAINSFATSAAMASGFDAALIVE
jgi:hypothetical protein